MRIYTLDELQRIAATITTSKLRPHLNLVDTSHAIVRYWVTHKELGTFATDELPIKEGGVARITVTGKILRWNGGDEVSVL